MLRDIKQPSEVRSVAYDLGDALGAATLVGIEAVTWELRGGGAGTLVKVNQQVLDDLVVVQWGGGQHGEEYLTTVRGISSEGDKPEADGVIRIRDITFVTPDIGAAPYLSSFDYVKRFGEQETTRITDEDSVNAIDYDKLEKALLDATQEAESYLRTRYTLPFAVAPAIVQGWVADLARERLFKTRATEQVTKAADRARSQLKDAAKGVITLPVADGDPEPEAITWGAPATSGDARPTVFTQEKMDRFTDLSGY